MTKVLNITENDPLKGRKMSFVNAIDNIDNQINSTQRDMEEHFLLFFSIIFSGLLGALITAHLLIPTLFTLGILLVLSLMIYFKEGKDKSKLIEERYSLVNRAKKEVNLDLRE